MTPALWAVLIPAVTGMLVALTAYLHSLANRERIAKLERSRGQGPTEAGRVAPRRE